MTDFILGPLADSQSQGLSRDLNIVLVWGEDCCHQPGYHEYEDFRDLWDSLLTEVPRVTVTDAFQFPSAAQWEAVDLVVFYLHLDFLEDSHYALMDPFIDRGGGMIFIHEAVIQRPTGEALALRCGLAWDDGTSDWGVLPNPVLMNTYLDHDIIRRFPDSVDFVDEFYWRLTGDTSLITILGTAQAGPTEQSSGPPTPDQLDGNQWPIFWTYEQGQGKVFGTALGHNFLSFTEPWFRAILFRAMAWAVDEPFEPFKALATRGLELDDDRFEGCTDPDAENFNPLASFSCSGCCIFPDCCMDDKYEEYNPNCKGEHDQQLCFTGIDGDGGVRVDPVDHIRVSRGKLYINCRGNFSVSLRNMRGEAVSSIYGTTSVALDLAGIPAGMYMVRLASDLFQKTERILHFY